MQPAERIKRSEEKTVGVRSKTAATLGNVSVSGSDPDEDSGVMPGAATQQLTGVKRQTELDCRLASLC